MIRDALVEECLAFVDDSLWERVAEGQPTEVPDTRHCLDLLLTQGNHIGGQSLEIIIDGTIP